MANRRFGGGNFPQKFGRPFSQDQPPYQGGGGGGVSPWQGGVAPNNSLGSGLLSQLTAPQAQLAIALSSILQNQPSQHMNNPPSLLSLNTSPNYNSQDNYGPQNRFSNRDFRRPEPFGKNRNSTGGTWRNDNFRGNRQGNSSNSGGQSRSRDRQSSGTAKPVVKPQNKIKPKTDDKNESKNESIDLSTEENRDEDGNESTKKREWKEEKNTSETGDNVEESEDAEDADGDEEKRGVKRPREGRYQGVPAQLLHCFVCTKSMWDGESYQNHIRGKAHKQMMDSLEESFQITANILRENLRLVEEKKMIEMERMQRNSRKYHRKAQEPMSHCNMCDLKFLGKILNHRKTESHQRLKRFLHPKCTYCNQEFPSRMEWVDHRFTPEHLKKLHEIMDTKTGQAEGAVLEEELEIDLNPLLGESLLTESDNPILELDDDLKDCQNRIPAFKSDRAVATNCLKPAEGFHCELCNRFMPDEVLAQAHLKTERHFHKFVAELKRREKAKNEVKSDEAANAKKPKLDEEAAEEETELEAEQAEEKTDDNGDAMYDPEEACNENETNDSTASDGVKNESVAEVAEIKEEAGDDEVVEVKEEKGKSPRNMARRGGCVRNAAGPKNRAVRGRK